MLTLEMLSRCLFFALRFDKFENLYRFFKIISKSRDGDVGVLFFAVSYEMSQGHNRINGFSASRII